MRKVATITITMAEGAVDDTTDLELDVRESLGDMPGVEHVSVIIEDEDPDPDAERFIDGKCPYTLPHTRNWCGYRECRRG